jgi:hypothetical protein
MDDKMDEMIVEPSSSIAADLESAAAALLCHIFAPTKQLIMQNPNNNNPANLTTQQTSLANYYTQLQLNPYNIDLTLEFLQLIRQSNLAEVSQYYDFLLSSYPSAANIWLQYIEHNLEAGQIDRVESLYNEVLLNVLDMELWTSYINYIEKTRAKGSSKNNNVMEVDSSKEASSELDAISRAYEFVLTHLQHDLHIVSIYKRYILYIKSSATSNNSQYEEASRMQRLRKLYQRCLVSACTGLDEVWRDYDSFEHSINKTIAKTLLAEYQPRYITAKTTARERKRRKQLIDSNLLPLPPDALNPSHNKLLYSQQLVYWRQFLEYEFTNPQRLSNPELKQRIILDFKQFLLIFRHFPDAWLDYAYWIAENYHQITVQSAAIEEANNVIKEAIVAINANPAGGPLINLLHAEFLEVNKNFTECRRLYEELTSGKFQWNSHYTTVIYINFMRFVRRTEGADAARKIFVLARKASAGVEWQLYHAAALIELKCNAAATVAVKIYDAAVKLWPENRELLLAHLNFLDSQGDLNNLRVTLERNINKHEEKQNQSSTKGFGGQGAKKLKREDGSSAEVAQEILDNSSSATAISLWDFGLINTNSIKKQRAAAIELGGGNAASSSAMDNLIGKQGSFGVADSSLFGSYNCGPSSNIVDYYSLAPFDTSRIGLLWYNYIQLERLTNTELTAIIKAEQRRESNLSLESSRIVLSMDRSRLFNLWPCSLNYRVILELAVKLEKQTLSTTTQLNTKSLKIVKGSEAAEAPLNPNIIRPNLNASNSTMYYPIKNTIIDPARFRISYGPSPVPDIIVNQIIMNLPWADHYNGPFYDINKLFQNLVNKAQSEVKSSAELEKQPIIWATLTSATSAAEEADTNVEKKEEAVDENSVGDIYKQRRANKLASK